MAYDFSRAEEIIRGSMADFNVPSLSIAVVSGQDTIYRALLGYKDMANRLAPDAQTRYACASVSKSMTAMGLGILRDEGKIDWDTPVINYIPELRLTDDYATTHVTLKDMLTHTTGMARHDASWYNIGGDDLTTPQYIARMAHLPFNRGFRAGYEYNNFMFTTAGYVIDKVAGIPWGQFLTERIFKPLGMHSTTTNIAGIRTASNAAVPYKLKNGEVRQFPYLNFDGMAGCGSVCSTIEDMAKWLALNMNGGQYAGKRIISERTLREIHAPRVIDPPDPEEPYWKEMPFAAYGLGWTVRPYRGHLCVCHSGSIDGFAAYQAFLPDEKLGVIAYANLEGTTLHFASVYQLFDALLGFGDINWPRRYKERAAILKAAADGRKAKAESIRNENAPPSRRLELYAGAYSDPGYGTVRVAAEDAGLVAHYNGMRLPLRHSNYDTFELNFGEYDFDMILPATFRAGANGPLERLEIFMEPGYGKPIIFIKDKE